MDKIITVIPVKNDDWIIEKSIKSSLFWSDHVFVLDESSNDKSHSIYKEFEKKYKNLSVVYNRPKFDFNTNRLRNYSLEIARNFDGNNIIFEIHADEILSSEIMKSKIKNMILNDVRVGDAIMLPWITLWERFPMLRDDKSVWSNNYTWAGFKDDRKVKFVNPTFHGSRAPESFLKNKFLIQELPLLHFQFLNLKLERSKQALYQVNELNQFPSKSIELINKTYACAYDDLNVNLVELDKKHYDFWLKKEIKLNIDFNTEKLNWKDIEVLRQFKFNGINKYKNSNIWEHIDWESKRIEAKSLNLSQIPDFRINDPRSLSTIISHKFLNKYQLYPFWRRGFIILLLQRINEKVKKHLKYINN